MTDAGEMGADLAIAPWVEQCKIPGGVTVKASGADANRVNIEVPARWSANRIQPLRVYPRWRVQRVGGYGECEQF